MKTPLNILTQDGHYGVIDLSDVQFIWESDRKVVAQFKNGKIVKIEADYKEFKTEVYRKLK